MQTSNQKPAFVISAQTAKINQEMIIMKSQTIPELLSAREIDQDQAAIIEFGRDSIENTSRREIFQQSGQLSSGLLKAGLEHGDRVAVMAPNSSDWVVSALGVMFSGAVIVPIDTQMPGEDLDHVLADCDPRFIFTTSDLKKRIKNIPENARIRLFDADEDSKDSWKGLFATETAEPIAKKDDLAAIFYTSGTTGPPKGVPLTHQNITSNMEALKPEQFLDKSDRVLVPLPFHHVYPFTVGILVELMLGVAIIVPYSLVGPQILRALREGKATAMIGVPRLYEAIWNALEDRLAGRGRVASIVFKSLLKTSMASRKYLKIRIGKLLFSSLHKRLGPDLRLVVSGGAALDPDLGRKFQALGWDVATGYGLSETSPILTFNPPEEIRLESAGKILPDVELSIDNSKSGDDRGEVMARGSNVFSGYWNLPDKTKKVLDRDGWFRTGDMGRIDEDGYLYLLGRESAMIVLSGGENIDPERAEKALAAAQDIREAGVLEYKNRLAAVVVPEASLLREASGDDLRRRIEKTVEQTAGDLPSHHRPTVLRVSMDPLPRTRLGKLRRHKLSELFQSLKDSDQVSEASPEPVSIESMSSEDQQLLSDPTAKKTWKYLAKRYDDLRLTPDSSLSLDLGIDSLNWVDLTLALREHAGVELDDSAISRVQSVRDLLRETAGAARAGTSGKDLVKELKEPEKLLESEQLNLLKPLGRSRRLVSALLYGIILFPARLFLLVKISGKPPENVPVVIAPRHLSALDPLVIIKAMDQDKLESFYWAGLTDLLFTNPLTRWLSRTARVLPVDPGSAPRTSLALASAALNRKHGLIWFPEGQRSTDGKLQEFKPGIGLVLRAQPVPVVPVWIKGTWDLMPLGRLLPRPGKAEIVFGEPIKPERFPENEREIAYLIHSEVEALGNN